MNLKLYCFTLSIILLNCTNTFAIDCSSNNLNKKQTYLCKRFVQVDYNNGTIDIDLNDVSMVRFDTHCHAAHDYYNNIGMSDANLDCAVWKNTWYLYLKNGKIISCAKKESAKTKYDEYRSFLLKNPEFIEIQ